MNENQRPPQEQPRQPGREHEMAPVPDSAPRHKGAGRLQGKAAIITGGDSGIGRATARLFAREGARVAIVYLDEHEDARRTRELVESEGADCLLISGDLRQEAFCRQAVEQAVTQFGRLDCLINNCAEQHLRDELAAIPAQQLIHTFETNVFSYFYMAKAALEYLPEGGTIINTTSITAYRGSDHLMDYAATRGAIVAFTRSLARNLVAKGIRVNGVAPGPIWTPLIPSSFDADDVSGFGGGSPMGRAGQPNEIAPSYLFLATDDSSYMTGQVLHPNGGEIIGG